MLNYEETQLVLAHMHLAEWVANDQLARFGMQGYDYDALVATGYWVITEVINRGVYRWVHNLPGYLTRCITIEVARIIKRHKFYVFTDKYLDTVDESGDDYFDYDLAEELILLLSPEEQKIIRMMYYDRLTLKDIGEKFNISTSAIYSRMDKIKTKLRKRKFEYGLIER